MKFLVRRKRRSRKGEAPTVRGGGGAEEKNDERALYLTRKCTMRDRATYTVLRKLN